MINRDSVICGCLITERECSGLAAPPKVPGTAVASRDKEPVKCVLIDTRLPSPAPENLDYLARQPEAQDTIDGILHWWVLVRKWARNPIPDDTL